ncbi:MAG: tail fiber domain-containing protein [Aquirufa sp.]
MKKSLTLLFLLVSFFAFSQNNGINFQGVGRNSSGAVLAAQKISLRFSVVQGSETGIVEYVESKEATTNAQGIFSVVIGDGTQISKTGNFTDVNWKIYPKFLKVEMDPAGGTSFAAMGSTRLQSVPFAYYANGVNADNVDGVLSASKGGTGVATISALKTALGVDQINNTNDLAKPISTATQVALDTKVSTATFSTTVVTKANITDVELKAPLESPTFTGIVSGITKAMVGLSNVENTADLAKPISAATQEALDTKVSTETFSTTVATKANIADVELKAPIESPTFTGTVSGITKAMVGLSNVENTADLAKPISTATQTALDTKISVSTFTTTLALYENSIHKSAAADLGGASPSDILYPTQKAVKEYVAANNAAGGIADGSITSIKIADAAVNFQKLQTIPANTILGNTTSIQASLQAITTTGTDKVVLSTSPTLVSPNLGQATATSINNVSINTLSGTASITVRGETTLRGNNNGDDAPNQRYENILGEGIVSLTTNQAIDGQKTFQNNIVMGNIGGLAGTSSPTTIDFANGSRIGDLDNINNGNPDLNGSIDLYAPDGAKWVELNYANRNYIAVTDNKIGFWVDNNEWEFNNFGITKIPYHTFLGGNIYFSQDGITENHNASIESNGPLLKIYARSETSQEDSIDVDYGIQLNFADKSRIDLLDDFMVSSITDTANKQSSNLILSKNSLSFDFFDEVNLYSNHWAFHGDDGSSWFPGDLNFTDNHAINFISAGTSTPTSNASINSIGPFLKIQTRPLTPDDDTEAENGISLEYENLNNIKINSSGVQLTTWNTNNSSPSFVNVSESSFNFFSNDNLNNQNRWYFNGADASTNLPGALLLTGNIETEGTLTLGSTIFTNQPATNGYVLTYNAGNAIWQAPTGGAGISIINGVSSGTHSFTSSNSGTDFSIQSDANTGIHTFNLPDASTNNRGLLTSADYATFYAKQNALTNPLTGTGTSGQLSFFNGPSSMTSSSELFWDASKNSLGIGIIPNSAFQKFDFISGAPNKNSLLIAAPNGDGAGSQIGFISNNGNDTNAGLFQLDGVGNMVFRTIQSNLSFDNFGEGDIEFRVGKIVGNGFNFTTPFKIKADQSINFYSNVNISSGTLSVTGNVYVDGTVSSAGTVLTSDIRLKNNILPIKNSLHLINQLNPVSYNKKISLSSNDYSISENGFIAQELQKILPDLVHESVDKDKLLSVNYTAIIPILTKGIQEQQAIIEDQKKRLDTLEKLVNELIKKQ